MISRIKTLNAIAASQLLNDAWGIRMNGLTVVWGLQNIASIRA
jgi:hypothetical protein